MSHSSSTFFEKIKGQKDFVRDFLFPGTDVCRDVHVGEKLVVLGRGEKVRGNVGSRLFYWASGGVAVVDAKGRLEIVITASGQYMGVDDLTAQMKMELIPQEFTSRAFSLAGS